MLGHESRVFTLSEVRACLPIIKKVTEYAYQQLQPFQYKLERMLCNDPRRKTVQVEYEEVVQTWKQKMERLGVLPVGLWQIEFDVGDAYICWKYAEIRVNYARSKASKHFSDRLSLPDYIELYDPDWASS